MSDHGWARRDAQPLSAGGALLKTLLVPALLAVSSTAARGEDLTPYLLEFGTARAQLWGVLQERPKGSGSFAFARADQLALNPDRSAWPYTATTTLTVTPLLSFDRNVNNGITSDTLYIFGVPFTVDEEARAVKALTAGAAVAGGVSFGLATGTTLTLSGRSAYERAVGKRFEVFNTTAAATLGYTAQDWAYANLGFVVHDTRRELADEHSKMATWTIGKLFGAAGSHLHDVSGTFLRAEENSTWQSRLRVDWTGTFAEYGVFKFGLEGGEEVGETLLPTLAVTSAYSHVIFGAPTTISVVISQKRGGTFFDTEREDRTSRIKLDRKVNDRLSVSISALRKNSTVDSFDDSYIDLGFQITGFRL